MKNNKPKGGPEGNRFQKPKNTGKTFSRLVGYIGKFKSRLLLVFFLVIIGSGANVFGVYMIGDTIDNGIVPLIGTTPTAQDFLPLIKRIALIAVVYICGAISSYTYSRIMIGVAQGTLNTIRRDLFDNMQDLPISFFDSKTHGELMSRFTNDTDTLRECISQSFIQAISSTITVVSTFVMMCVISMKLTALIIAMLFIMMFIIKFVGSRSAHFFRRQQKAVGAVNGYIEELIEGQKVVKVFCHEKAVKSDFDVLNSELRHAATNANTYASIIMPIMGNISYINYAATAVIGAYIMVKGAGAFGIGDIFSALFSWDAAVLAAPLTIGSLASFLQYTRQFSQPITQISQQFNVILAALAGAERIFEIIDTPHEEDDGYVMLVNAKKDENGNITECEEKTGLWAWKHNHHDGTTTYVELKGDVRFHDVTFSYDGRKTVLKNVSLYARPGEKIAFVGSTGAGKTTITNLINRFYDVQEGKITYDGINIKKIKKDDLRRSLAMVLQDTHLFTGTVRENIAYGKLDATQEEIERAAKLANAHSFITRLPQGYDTVITGDGGNLSQGQRQLLAIARAAVADPPVLILDEATSSIDTRTEHLIELGMDRLMAGRTVFVIAHRLSTVRNSNAIMVLEHGEIIERGNHDDLIAQQGKYYQLYTGQFELD
ncbi:MAG: ABC transporter ATP-binding protein [Clostridia bacterium]|nr:ABC transporter ATP-binding protein [Clostridia bacterium]